MKDTNMEVFYSYSVFEQAEPYRRRFQQLAQKAAYLRTLCLEGEQLLPQFTNIVGDIWFAFYQTERTWKEPARASNRHFLQTMMATEEYKRWQLLTAHDELLAILTTMSLAEQLLRYLQAQQSPSYGNPTQPEQSLAAMTQQACASLLLHSTEQAKQSKQLIQTVSSLNGEPLEHMPLTEQFELAHALQSNTTLKKVAELTGKLKRIALRKQKQREHETMARQHVTIGQEIGRLLPLELASYVMPQSRLAFLQKFTEHQTFVFDTKGKDTRGRGPIIICMDESSSMTSIKVESKAFCLALLYIARRQRRDLAIIPFASDIGAIQIFKKGQCDTAALTQYSEAFLGGGTNYEKPLTAALEVLQMSKFKKADIIFVTDGSSFLSTSFIEQFNRVKKERQCECTTIVLKNMINTVDMTLVHRFSNKVIAVDELLEASEVFALQ